MYNQIKSEFLKLRYSKLFKAIPILLIFGLALYWLFSLSAGGTQVLVSEGDEETDKTLQGMIGFFAFTFADESRPEFREIMQSCMSCNVFLWVFILIFTIQFFCYDYSSGTIKLSVAYGISRIKVYLAKVVVIMLYSAACYFLFSILSVCFTCFRVDYMPNVGDMVQYLEFTGLNFLVMVSFIMLCLIVSICVKNTGIIATVMCVFMLGGAVIYTGIWQNFHSHMVLKYLVWVNPFYYWMNMGAFRLDYGIIHEIMGYFMFGVVIILPVSVLLVRKQEFK